MRWEVNVREEKCIQDFAGKILRGMPWAQEDVKTSYNLLNKNNIKRQLGKPYRRWDNNNRLDLKEAGWNGVD
jgi:hypothetical protein